MIYQKQLPKKLWAEAVNAAAYAMNRTTNCNNTKVTPYELWYKTKSNIAHMRPFGTDAFALIPALKRAKFDAKAEKDILVGYKEGSNKKYRNLQSEKRRSICCKKCNVQ